MSRLPMAEYCYYCDMGRPTQPIEHVLPAGDKVPCKNSLSEIVRATQELVKREVREILEGRKRIDRRVFKKIHEINISRGD